MTFESTILDEFGSRFKLPSPNGKHSRPWPTAPEEPRSIKLKKQAAPDIEATYDLAQTDLENSKHWGAADSYNADSANSRAVRLLMIRRSRMETQNNGYVCGLLRTDSTFVIRKGPRLRLTSSSETELRETNLDKDQIKHDWHKWCKAVKFRRKLWTMAHAHVQDGEGFGIVRHNPNVAHPVKLDVVLVEAEQVYTPMLPVGVVGYIDGIRFDPWGNPIYYDVMPVHPGDQHVSNFSYTPDAIPAKYMLHWYSAERPGQHRGIPALASTLGLGAVGRRWREATVASAETIADISLIAQTQGAPMDGADEFAPFGAIEWQKRMMMMLPMGWNVFQPQGTSPPANYDMFVRAQLSELARPRSMPYNLAASDSSNHSFASGKLDTQPYYMTIDDLDREDCNDLVLDPLFALWWKEYVLVCHSKGEMLDADKDDPPDRAWDWPRNPVADEASEVRTNAEKMRTGQTSPSDIAHTNGESFEDLLLRMSKDYGKPVDEIREALFQVNIAPKSGGMIPGGKPGGGGAPGPKPPAGKGPANPAIPSAAPKTNPEPNGEDAPTMEQMSSIVSRLADSVQQLQQHILAGAVK